ncbi:hypothetical protein ACL02S_22245 [Nocardia sp. 004]|uniref:hypothetical protein n=1 Tax=Nocardia sp. 004 TaxID=3385978 RepID=UPI0039A1F8AA
MNQSRSTSDAIAATQWADQQRWRRCQVPDNPLAGEIVVRVWGRVPDLYWQMLATALIAQRLEDGQATPRTAADPVAVELEVQIDQAFQALNRNSSSTS